MSTDDDTWTEDAYAFALRQVGGCSERCRLAVRLDPHDPRRRPQYHAVEVNHWRGSDGWRFTETFIYEMSPAQFDAAHEYAPMMHTIAKWIDAGHTIGGRLLNLDEP